MRDPKLMISLLKEMSKNDMGRLITPLAIGMDGRKQQLHHHVELLVDAGHAQWAGDNHQIARITNAGYDFLNAATNPRDGEKATAKFIELFNGGVSYARAAQAAIEVVAKAMGA